MLVPIDPLMAGYYVPIMSTRCVPPNSDAPFCSSMAMGTRKARRVGLAPAGLYTTLYPTGVLAPPWPYLAGNALPGKVSIFLLHISQH